MRLWITFGIIAIGIFLAATFAILLPISAAGKGENGTFVNDYRGTITLIDGEMFR